MPAFALSYDLEVGKCYYITGSTTNVGGGEQAQFQMGDNSTFVTVGTITTNGGFSILFTYDGSVTYSHIKINVTGVLEIHNIKLRLQYACADRICSECYRIQDCEPPHREHILLQWTNNEDGFGFNYSNMDFMQSLYVVAGLRNADYPYDEEIFADSQQHRYPVYTQATKTKELWIHDVPEYIHDALRIALVHDDIWINGLKYVKLEGGYTPDWDTPNSMMAPVIVKVAEFEQDTTNDNCI